MKNSSSRNAFTLLEMAIVLAILALLAHLTVSRLDRSTFKPKQAERLLDSLSTAILGSPSDLDPAGQPTRCGFVADMGRLPQAVPSPSGAPSLCELWQCPATDSFAVRPATLENLAPGSDPADADPQVFLACGWRGPYIEPTAAAGTLLDPWGNPIALNDATAPADAPITRLTTLGSDGAPGWDNHTESARDLSLSLTASASLTVIPTFRTTLSTNEVSTLSIDPLPRPTKLRVYSPLGARIAVASTPLELLASGAPLTLTNLTPGPRVFRIERDGLRTDIRSVLLSPGPNIVRLP